MASFTLARSGSLLQENGCFLAGIPSDGGLLWGLAWRFFTGLAYKLRTGLSYKTLVRHEHINRADEIIALVRYFFDDVKVKYFPLPGINYSVFIYLECWKPKLEVCRKYLAI